jgi:chaperonin cofactor prefoldin
MALRGQLRWQAAAGALLLAALATHAGAQVRDPLTPQEANQVRDTAGKLDQRVPLLVQFAGERLRQFEQVRTAAPADRASRLYALLQQYAAILPELDDAVDDLGDSRDDKNGPHYKVGKVLGKAVADLQQLQATLQHIQSSSSPADLATYHFELQNCLDATRDSLQNAQGLLKPS